MFSSDFKSYVTHLANTYINRLWVTWMVSAIIHLILIGINAFFDLSFHSQLWFRYYALLVDSLCNTWAVFFVLGIVCIILVLIYKGIKWCAKKVQSVSVLTQNRFINTCYIMFVFSGICALVFTALGLPPLIVIVAGFTAVLSGVVVIIFAILFSISTS